MRAERPVVIEGGIARDERGAVGYVNDFVMTDVRRFYVISFASKGYVRAWIGHRFERKWFCAVSGKIALVVRRIEAFEKDGPADDAETFFLDADAPRVVALPQGYAIGMKALSEDARMLVYSDKTMEEAKEDVVRFPKDHGFDWEGV